MATTLATRNNATMPATSTANKPTRWEPFDLINSLQEDFDRFFRPLGTGRPFLTETLLRDMQVPRTDIFEQDGHLVINAELPGIKKEAIQISLEQGDLVIRAESQSAAETKEKDFYRMERRSGRFYRSVPLPFAVEPDQITAKYTDGVLEIRIPKPVEKQAETKRIAVQ